MNQDSRGFESQVEMGKQIRVAPGTTAPADMAVGPHETSRRLRAIAAGEFPVAIAIDRDLDLICQAVCCRDRDDPKMLTAARGDFGGEGREIRKAVRA